MTTTDREIYQLCFVRGCWAYFANVPPTEVRGDDWDDAPYDCNAGEPYEREGQEIVCVAYDGPYEENCQACLSADQINRGEGPWLVDRGYGTTYPKWADRVDAGTTLADFKARITWASGSVYERVES